MFRSWGIKEIENLNFFINIFIRINNSFILFFYGLSLDRNQILNDHYKFSKEGIV